MIIKRVKRHIKNDTSSEVNALPFSNNEKTDDINDDFFLPEDENKTVLKNPDEFGNGLSDNADGGGDLSNAENSEGDNLFADINFEDINFESRNERRQGTRRRGYRRTEDKNLVSRAQAEAEAIRAQAIEEGRKEGLAAAEKDINDLNNALLDFFEYKNKMFDLVSAGIYSISTEIAGKILGRELKQDKTALLSLIKNALGDVYKVQNRITIKVRTEDVPILKETLPELLIDGNNEINVNVVPDDNIVSGGAIIITENGIIDATVETGLSILEQAFKQLEE